MFRNCSIAVCRSRTNSILLLSKKYCEKRFNSKLGEMTSLAFSSPWNLGIEKEVNLKGQKWMRKKTLQAFHIYILFDCVGNT